MEIDQIIFCLMDITFVVVNFGIGYITLYKQFHLVNSSIKYVIYGLYLLLVIQAISSVAIVILLF